MNRTATFLSATLALLVGAFAPPVAAASCVSDLNGDRNVDQADIGILLGNWGRPGIGDANGDGNVDGADLGMMFVAWGACPVTVPAWATLVEAQPNPAVVTDPALRAAIAATGLAWRVRDTGTQMEMMLIPPGTFQMGCIMGSNAYGCYPDEQPAHQVTLTNAFYLGRYEVTQPQWVAKMGQNPSFFSTSHGYPGPDDRPVETVSWQKVQGYLSATGMRLPTEAEWEYACRAGTETPFHNGSTDDNTVGTIAWFLYSPCPGGQGRCGSRGVGLLAANGLGLHDMLGNVAEWVNDRFGAYPSSAQTNPTGSTDALELDRVTRGGAWSDGTYFVRSDTRSQNLYGVAINNLGFRVARNP